MKNNILTEKWDEAAHLIHEDPMRPIRYGMCIRYFIRKERDIRILEIGCGEGTGLKYLSYLKFDNLFGIEVSQVRCEYARKLLGDRATIHYYSPNLEPLPFQNNSFDIIMSSAVIEHVEDPKYYLDEIYRVLRPNGNVVISSDCFTWRILQILGVYKSVQPIDKTYKFKTFKKKFESSGFSLLHFDSFNLPNRRTPYTLILGMVPRIFKMFSKSKQIISTEDPLDIFIKHANSKINTSKKYYFWQKILNYFNDENVFYLKKK